MSNKAKAPRVFVPLTKVDEAQRLVYGRITQEMLDKSKEVMDYDSSKPHFEKWSNEIHENSGGLSKGNVRVMHGLTAAGKLTELDFDDSDKAIDVCAKVVDDAEWNKVVEGVYTGFSVGGSYGKKWTETLGGEKIKKFTAIPNEVSLVDNPCVPSATFSMFKADGSEEAVAFKVENDDEEWPDFAKADTGGEESAAETQAEPEQGELPLTNDQIVAKAEEIAKAAGDPSKTWMDFVSDARDELLKAAKGGTAQKATEEGGDPKKADKKEAKNDAKEDEEEEKEEAKKADVRNELKQVWSCTDGKTFEKKADAEAHEATLKKAAPTEVEQLKARLEKALKPEEEAPAVSILSLDRVDDLHKAVLELELPRGEDGAPLLEKGMYTVSRFANMLGDVAGLARTIKAEGKLEGDENDENVSKTLVSQLDAFGGSFMTYAKQQVAELVAGLDTDLSPRCAYDYYYRAAGEGNDLAKNVVELIEAVEDEREAAVEKLAKSVGIVEEVETDELTPALQKRFDDLEKDRDEFKKIAEDAVGRIETLTKRVEEIADQPLPRAPRNPQLLPGDQFLGKTVTSDAEKVAVLKEMIDTHGSDGLATMMIKAAHASGGQQLQLKQ